MTIFANFFPPVIVFLLLLHPKNSESAKLLESAKKLDVVPRADDACFYGKRLLILSDPSGWFVSPNYPLNYPNNANCQWLIVSPEPGRIIRLDFSEVRTEADYDLLTIYDGNSTSATAIAQFDGSSWTPAPTNIRSTGPSMLVVLSTDYTANERGFNATYTLTDLELAPDPCYPLSRPLLLTNYNGTFQSNGFPVSNYWNYAECSWLIESQETGGTVQLWFETFVTEADYDVIMIYDGQSTASQLIGIVHGKRVNTNPPMMYRSTRQYMFVRFYSDYRTVDIGFRAFYQSLPGKATTVATTTTSRPTSCGSILHVSPAEANISPGYDLMCHIGLKDTGHLDTPCFDLIQQLPEIGNATSLLSRGGNFGCLLSTSNDFSDTQNSCFDNYQWFLQLGQCFNCIYLFVCIKLP